MKAGIDTNVLVYAHLPALAHHAPVKRYVERLLGQSQTVLALTPQVLHEFVHIVTDARRFDPPLLMAEALAVARSYLNKANIACLSVTEGTIARTFDMLEQYQLGRKRIADTLFAATLLENGFTKLLTCNLSDFALFEDLSLIDPTRAESR